MVKRTGGKRHASTAEQGAVSARRGRPAIQRERAVKTGVVLLARHLGFLDRLCLDIRDATGRAITRSDVLRGMIEGIIASSLDLTTAADEAEIGEVIRARLRR